MIEASDDATWDKKKHFSKVIAKSMGVLNDCCVPCSPSLRPLSSLEGLL